MSMQDTIADMLTRLRNGQSAGKSQVKMPSSKVKVAIAKVLLDEGYISGHEVSEGSKPELTVELKYVNGEPVIETIDRISKSGCRVYKSADELPEVLNGLGIAIISTSAGLMTARAAAAAGHGGEVICTVT